jgi:hypothetical protein
MISFPLSFSSSADDIRKKLIARGRKFESLRGYHFRTCHGTKILLETEFPEERPVAGRVIIDAFAYYTSNNIVKPNLVSLDKISEEPDQGRGVHEESSDTAEESKDAVEDEYENVVESEDGDDSDLTAVKASDTSLKRVEDPKALTDEQCLLATPWVKGLDLKTKDWAQFNVDELADVVWNDDAFNHLVLPGNEKNLAWSFVENKCLSDNQFDDFVPDKGRGIIILWVASRLFPAGLPCKPTNFVTGCSALLA